MEKVVIGIIITLIIGSSALLIKNVSGFSTSQWQDFNPLQALFDEINNSLKEFVPEATISIDSSATASSSLNTPQPTPTTTPTQKAPEQTASPSTKAPTQTTRACYRATAYHLDGSTSTLCYSSSDANAINALASQYRSAKNFYEFHLRGVTRYQEEYEKTGADIYLDAKQRSQEDANEEKAKMDQAVAAMQDIEKRGF